MIQKAAILLAVILGFFILYVAMKSPDYVITRQITIHAPAEKIFPFLNNTKLAELWGPWKDVDPDATMSYTGPEEGIGAKTSWVGGKQLGTGSATIVDSVANAKVDIKLEYSKPMAMTQDSEYLITPDGAQNVVSWTVKGQNGFAGRLMSTFVDMDKVVGGMFEKGLAKLKAVVEKQAADSP